MGFSWAVIRQVKPKGPSTIHGKQPKLVPCGNTHLFCCLLIDARAKSLLCCEVLNFSEADDYFTEGRF